MRKFREQVKQVENGFGDIEERLKSIESLKQMNQKTVMEQSQRIRDMLEIKKRKDIQRMLDRRKEKDMIPK